MTENDEQVSTVDVIDEPVPDPGSGTESRVAHDEAIASFLAGDLGDTTSRENAWTRVVAMAGYSLRDALRGIRRRPGLATSAVLTVSLCAVLAGGAAIARAGVDATMSRWADGVEFVVYLQPGATRDDAARVRHELESAEGVRRVTRVTQEQAFVEYRRLYAGDATMTDAVTPDLLPSSFRVAPVDADPSLIRRITRPLTSDPAVYQVVTADDAVRDVRDLSGAVSGLGTWLAVLLGVVGVVLSATMIRSSITARQREIDMMRSLGAGRTYIAAPVAIEGVVIGIVGAGVAGALLCAAAWRAGSSTSSVVSSLLPSAAGTRAVVVVVMVVTVLVCTLVSILTTATALRRSR
ncbi:MAG: FtsX-like permease family protein [Actinobacteria bacterium]|nr:FtsX-like permease family protein [Actinomycetota bacterium]